MFGILIERKGVFEHMQTEKAQINLRIRKQLLGTVECSNGDKMSG